VALLLTLDASVFVAAARQGEPGHAASALLLAAIADAAVPLVEPTLLPIEVAAALGRTGTAAALAREYAEAIIALPGMTLVAVDERLARRTVSLSVAHRLRGADAVYAAVAVMYGARIVTLDREQLARTPTAVAACRPVEALTWLERGPRRRPTDIP
jgi:predicted nucleic acid-binding protein